MNQTEHRRRFVPKAIMLLLLIGPRVAGQPPEHVQVGSDGHGFVLATSQRPITLWGVNYDHDGAGRLLDEYWIDEWETVVEDFREIKRLGANCVRIHLQFGKLMKSFDRADESSVRQLRQLVRLAEDLQLYLNVTGLACYHKQNIPENFDTLGESERWAAQSAFWRAVAQACQDSPAIFCYDLMNEPILPGAQPAKEWLAGELDGKFFVQRLTLDLGQRSRVEVAEAWTAQMVSAIRQHDQRHLITVGVIPWIHVFGGGTPLFYSPQVAQHLDFVAVHFYPTTGAVEQAVVALSKYDIGKPILVEEMFPLKCSVAELRQFVHKSNAAGWLSFYWGTPARELRANPEATIGHAITADWLDAFAELSDSITLVNGK